MSKISITPSATGTGVFKISSPATNTDRTLTLPDEAGTVLTSASSLASANLTGALPAIDGSALTNTIFTEKYESSWEATNNGLNQFYTHGLTGTPTLTMGLFRVANDDTYPHILFGSIGNFGTASGNDYGIAMAVSNTHIVCAIGENGVSPDWGTSDNNNFPYDSLASHINLDGTGSDYIDTPTETSGPLLSGYIKIIAYR